MLKMYLPLQNEKVNIKRGNTLSHKRTSFLSTKEIAFVEYKWPIISLSLLCEDNEYSHYFFIFEIVI